MFDTIASMMLVLTPVQDAAADPIRAANLYSGVRREVPIEIADVGGDLLMRLVLMDADGQLVYGPLDVEPGTLDLGQAMPGIWEIRRTCYLQLFSGNEPVGSSLVVQPLINRPPIWTERALRPDGKTRYTRIVGWGNVPPPGWKGAAPSPPADAGEAPPTPPPAGDTQPHDPPEIEEDAFSGLRIYPERDVIIETSKGDIQIALSPHEAPNTAWNFRDLASNGFYMEVVFHRIVPLERNGWPFVIQGGDPSATGSGGPGYWLPIEPSTLPHDFGVISMARADDPDSAGSQFFICLSREGTARLDGQYCSFGYAVKGAKTIRAIAEVELADVAAGKPVDPPIVYRTRLVPAPPRQSGVGRPDRKVEPNDESDSRPATGNRR